MRSTVRDLEQLQTGASVAGVAANVSKPNDVAALAKFASAQLGTIDLWCAVARRWPAVVIAQESFSLRRCGLGACRINNAGSNAYSYGPLANATDADLMNIVETNVLGVMLCCREVLCMPRRAGAFFQPSLRLRGRLRTLSFGSVQAINLMKSQPSGGHIFLMDGAGADGSATPRFAAYGASKRGLAQLRKSLQVTAAPLARSLPHVFTT